MDFELQQWSEAHRSPFVAMQSDSEVMADLGGPYAQQESNSKFDRYRDAWFNDGISRWAVVERAGRFLGYAGVMKREDADHPLGPHYEIGWRFNRFAWGKGLATRSASIALQHAWTVLSTREIFSYTAADNRRSQLVMTRLSLKRVPTRDFTAPYERGDWTGLVWIAERPLTALPVP